MIRSIFAFFGLLGLAAGQYPYSVMPANPQTAFTVNGIPEANRTIVQVQGMPFTWAWRLTTPAQKAENPWDYRILADASAAVSAGDQMLAVFYMRTISSTVARGFVDLELEQNGSPWAGLASWITSTPAGDPEWTLVEVPFQVTENYAAGGYSIHLWIAFDEQVIEVGGLTILDYGPNVTWRDLNLTTFPYPGYEPNAAWRAAADARIEQYRKGDIVVVARDDQGNPVPNAPVHVKMKRHAFRFGSAVTSWTIEDGSQQQYRNKIVELFNSAVIENAFKWTEWDEDRNIGISSTDWLRSQGLSVRGHTVVWPGWAFLPVWLSDQVGNTEQLRQSVRNHVTDIVSATRGRLIDWDVVNEPYTSHDLQNLLGEEEVAEWFRLARQADAGANLYLNDFGILSEGGNNTPHQDDYFRVATQMDSLGAPLQGLGFQSHFNAQLTDPDRVYEVLNRYAALDKDLLITEFDINTTDEELQADYTRDFMTITFSHPSVKGFYTWGFWEGRHWLPVAAMYRANWQIKPNGTVWNDLIFNQWWTDEQGTADANGVYRTRGFLGEYDIDVTRGGSVNTVPLMLEAADLPQYATIGKQTAGSFPAAGITNAASFLAGPVAPGEIITIFGTNIGEPELLLAYYNNGYLPRYVGDTKVYFDGVPARMIHSLTGQVSALVPYSVSGSTRIEIEYMGVKTAAVTVPVAKTAPGIFCINGNPTRAVAVNNGGTVLNSENNPVNKGGILTLFVTGEGPVTPGIEDGELQGPPNFSKPTETFEVYISGRKCVIKFVGLVYAGVTQVNVVVPNDADSGNAVSLQVVAGGVASQPGVTICVQ